MARNKTPEERSKQQNASVKRIRRRYKVDLDKKKKFYAGEKDFARDMVVVLKLAGYSNSQIGGIVGISRGQVKAFLDEPEVADKLSTLRNSLPQAALDLLQGYSIEAVQAIIDVMRRSHDDKIVIMAASEVLDRAGLPKVSRTTSQIHKTEEHRTTLTDDGIVEQIRTLSPQQQEEAAVLIEGLEKLLGEEDK